MKRLGRRGVTHRVDRDRCQAVARRYRHGPKAGLGKRRFRRQASPPEDGLSDTGEHRADLS